MLHGGRAGYLWGVRLACVQCPTRCASFRVRDTGGEKFSPSAVSEDTCPVDSPFRLYLVAEHLLPARSNHSQKRYRLAMNANGVSLEAHAVAVACKAEGLLPLIMLAESRATLDLRALTNMRGGRLKGQHQESSDYADELKQIDTYQTQQDSQRVL